MCQCVIVLVCCDVCYFDVFYLLMLALCSMFLISDSQQGLIGFSVVLHSFSASAVFEKNEPVLVRFSLHYLCELMRD